jgi:hypothetical protein
LVKTRNDREGPACKLTQQARLLTREQMR